MYTSNDGGTGTYIQVANADLPTWLYTSGASNSFIIGSWIYRPSAASTTFRTAYFFQNLVVNRNSGTAQGGRLISDTATIQSITANVGAGSEDNWIYQMIGWDKGTSRFWTCSKGPNGLISNFVTLAAFSTHTPGDFYMMKNFVTGTDGGGGNVNGFYGDLGPLVVKNFQTSTQATYEAIVEDIYDSKNALGLLTYVGNGLNGDADAEWMAFNVSLPQDGDLNIVPGATLGIRNGTTLTSGAAINFAWLRKGAGVTSSGSFDEYRSATVAGTVTASDHEALVPNFFIREVPGETTNGVNSVNCPIAKRVFNNTPRGIEKILVWSNSRGMRGENFAAGPINTELYYNYPGNHAHGYLAVTWPKTAGFMCSPVIDGANRRFGHDCPTLPFISGTTAQASSSSTTYRDFTHFWTNSGRSGQGPGRGMVLVSNGAAVCEKGRKAPGSLLDGVQGTGWKHRAHVIAFPGSADVTVSLEESAAQDTAGTPSVVGTMSLDTAITPGGPITIVAYSAGSRLITLLGEGLGITAGMAVYVAEGTGQHGLADITDVLEDSGNTLITIRHAFAIAINPLDLTTVLKFGPWRIETFEYSAPLPTLEYQGLRLTRDSVADRIAVVLGLDVWAEGVSGWVWGQAGWGGNGYDPQEEEGATNLPPIILEALTADALFMHNATQSTTTAERKEFADLCATYLSTEQILYCSDQQHGTDELTSGQWANESLSQSSYPAVVGMESPLVGTGFAQYSMYQKHNSAHPSFEGMYAIALANVEQMEAFRDDADRGGNMRNNIRPWRGRV